MSAEVEAIARAWMMHQGHTDNQVLLAEQQTHENSGCDREDNAWNCDRNACGGSNHPEWDALREACEMANVAIDALQSIGSLCTDDPCNNRDHYELRA